MPTIKIGDIYKDTDSILSQNEGIIIILDKRKVFGTFVYKIFSLTHMKIFEHGSGIIEEYYELL